MNSKEWWCQNKILFFTLGTLLVILWTLAGYKWWTVFIFILFFYDPILFIFFFNCWLKLQTGFVGSLLSALIETLEGNVSHLVAIWKESHDPHTRPGKKDFRETKCPTWYKKPVTFCSLRSIQKWTPITEATSSMVPSGEVVHDFGNEIDEVTFNDRISSCLFLFFLTGVNILVFRLIERLKKVGRFEKYTFFSSPSCRSCMLLRRWLSLLLRAALWCSGRSGGGDTLWPSGSTHVYTWLVTKPPGIRPTERTERLSFLLPFSTWGKYSWVLL